MIFSGVFSSRLRGFRVLDLVALAVLLVLALGSYAFKTFAGAETADTAGVQVQIVQEQKRIRLLQAEIAHLEDPQRIERLSTQYLGLQAVAPKQEIAAQDLARVAALRTAPPPPLGSPDAKSGDSSAAPASAASTALADER
jgi:cell division protein FtsL